MNTMEGAEMAKKKTNMDHIGKTIKKARLEKAIDLNLLANETGLSIEFLTQVESGEQRPPVGTLLQISRALGIDSGFFLKAQEDSAEQRVEAYTKRTDNYAYTPLTPGAANKHLKAFRILVEANKAHGGVGFLHEGEEFIYVLKGEVEVMVGDHVNVLKTGESLHFNSSIKHDLKNLGDIDAELIVVVYSP